LKKNNFKKIVLWIASVVLAITLLLGGCVFYLTDYYSADREAIAAFSHLAEVDKNVSSDGWIAYGNPSSEVGFIFYPGGKVEFTAYEPLMKELACKGIFCILVEMPFHLAVLDINAADGLQRNYPEIGSWYIGGHSLGGSMAASYLEKHSEEFEGLVLLGAYSTADLSETDLSVLSLYGSEDLVMDREKYEKYKKNLSARLTEFVIEGGCHAYFGAYGEQKGDGKPKLSAEDQIRIGSERIADFMMQGGK